MADQKFADLMFSIAEEPVSKWLSKVLGVSFKTHFRGTARHDKLTYESNGYVYVIQLVAADTAGTDDTALLPACKEVKDIYDFLVYATANIANCVFSSKVDEFNKVIANKGDDCQEADELRRFSRIKNFKFVVRSGRIMVDYVSNEQHKQIVLMKTNGNPDAIQALSEVIQTPEHEKQRHEDEEAVNAHVLKISVVKIPKDDYIRTMTATNICDKLAKIEL
jgi:hypothetical protein